MRKENFIPEHGFVRAWADAEVFRFFFSIAAHLARRDHQKGLKMVAYAIEETALSLALELSGDFDGLARENFSRVGKFLRLKLDEKGYPVRRFAV